MLREMDTVYDYLLVPYQFGYHNNTYNNICLKGSTLKPQQEILSWSAMGGLPVFESLGLS